MQCLLVGSHHTALTHYFSLMRRRCPKVFPSSSVHTKWPLKPAQSSLNREKVKYTGYRENINAIISCSRTFTCALSTLSPLHERRLHSPSSPSSNGRPTAQVTPITTSVNLTPLIPTQVLSSIQNFPEVTAVLAYIHKSIPTMNKSCSLQMSQGLDRTLEVFASLDMKEEMRAVKMLQINLDVENCDYSDAFKKLDEILSEMQVNELRLLEDYTTMELRLAQSKVLWLQGNFSKSLCVLNELLIDNDVAINSETRVGKMLLASIWNAKAVLLLVLGDQSRTMAEEASRTSCLLLNAELEQEGGQMSSQIIPLKLMTAVSYMNLGLMEWVISPNSKHGKADMTSWETSLELIEDYKSQEESKDRKNVTTCELPDCIHAHILCIMTHAILFQKTSKSSYQLLESDLQLASEYSGKALSLYDSLAAKYKNTCAGDEDASGAIPVQLKRNIGRALSLVASCYARAGSQVTAEGLFKSALDSLLVGPSLPRSQIRNHHEEILRRTSRDDLDPITRLHARMCFLEFARLCQNWERRESDARQYERLAEKLTRDFPGDWGSSGVITDDAIGFNSRVELINGGAAWFFSVNDFKY